MTTLEAQAMALHADLVELCLLAARDYFETDRIHDPAAAARLARVRRVERHALDRWARRQVRVKVQEEEAT